MGSSLITLIMDKYEKLFKFMEKFSKKVLKTNQILEHSPVDYFHFIEKGKLLRSRHFDIKAFNNFCTYSSEFDRFFLTSKYEVFIDTVNISRVFPVRSFTVGSIPTKVSHLCNIKLCDTSLVTKISESDLTSAPLLPLVAGLVLQFYLENPSCNINMESYVGTSYNWPLLLDKFPMYKVYDNIYLLLDEELRVKGYTLKQRSLVQHEFARALSGVVAVNDSSPNITGLTRLNEFTIDKVSLIKNL